MRRDVLSRLETLETRLQQRGDSDPQRLHLALASLGWETPAPRLRESTKDWLKRVPSKALEALIEMRDANA